MQSPSSPNVEQAILSVAQAINNNFGAAKFASAYVSTLETRSSTSYGDLTTTTDTVTVTISATGVAIVFISAKLYNNTGTGHANIAVELSGANSQSADTSRALAIQEVSGNYTYNLGLPLLYVGLAPGSTTFKLKYKSEVTGTASFADRRLSVIAP